jgi:hypothetical protein
MHDLLPTLLGCRDEPCADAGRVVLVRLVHEPVFRSFTLSARR